MSRLLLLCVFSAVLSAGAVHAQEAGAAEDPRTAFPSLSSENAATRAHAVMDLGRQENLERVITPDPTAALLAMLQRDDDPEVRARVAWALGRRGGVGVIPALSSALRDDESRRVRRAAALALGAFDTPQSRTVLTAALVDSDEQVAAAAVEALSQSSGAGAEKHLLAAAADPRALVSLTAKRALARMGRPTSAPTPTPPPTPRKQEVQWCGLPINAGPCPPRRDQSDGVKADALLVASGTLLGALGGAFAPDALRPRRQGVLVTPTRTSSIDNTATPLERTIGGALGAGAGLAASGVLALLDDVTLSRYGVIALLTAEGVGMGAGVSLAFNAPRHVALSSMIGLGVASAVAGSALTWMHRDFGYGDVAFVFGNAALGFGAGTLLAVVLIPAGVGRENGKEGYVTDVGDLLGGGRNFYRLPWGPVGRLELALAGGLLASGVSTGITLLSLPWVEVGVTRVLKTVGASCVAAMVVGVPVALLAPGLPAPFPTPDRVGAGLGLLAGAAAGATVFALSSNDDEIGPLVAFESLRRRKVTSAPITLSAPQVSVMPPLPAAAQSGKSGAGVYLGLVNARFW